MLWVSIIKTTKGNVLHSLQTFEDNTPSIQKVYAFGNESDILLELESRRCTVAIANDNGYISHDSHIDDLNIEICLVVLKALRFSNGQESTND